LTSLWLLYLSFLLKNEGKKENVKWSTLKCLLSQPLEAFQIDALLGLSLSVALCSLLAISNCDARS
jgi:hypothetical protein